MSGEQDRGRRGEALVGRYLEERGWTILARNYHSRYGEIDLIAENGVFLAFVEVKLRKRGGGIRGREAVDLRKQDRLRKTALMYLTQRETALQPRFDVAEVEDGPEGPVIAYLENAF